MTILLFIARLLGPLIPYLAVWAAAKRDSRQKAKIEGLEGYQKTREAIDNVESVTDPDLARKRLRERNPKQH